MGTCQQNEVCSVPVKISSLAGPDTEVTFELWPEKTGITLLPAKINLIRGAVVVASLKFVISGDTFLGNNSINIVTSGFNDLVRYSVSGLTLNITPGVAFVSLKSRSDIRTRHGTDISIIIGVDLLGSMNSADFVVTPETLP